MAGVGLLFSVASGIMQTVAGVQQANTNAAMAHANAERQRAAGIAEVAAASSNAAKFTRQGEAAASRAQAGFAGSGGGLGGTTDNVVGGIYDKSLLDNRETVWNGQNRKTTYDNAAQLSDASGDAYSKSIPLIMGSGALKTFSAFAGGGNSTVLRSDDNDYFFGPKAPSQNFRNSYAS